MRTPLHLAPILIAALLCACTPANSESDVATAVTAFHTAVKSGDSTAAQALLADDAIFMESGGIETRAEYIANHLPEDIKFEKDVTSTWTPYKVTVQGDIAWATSTEDITGTFEDSPISLAVVESMVLSRQDGAWKIRSISWSSRRR